MTDQGVTLTLPRPENERAANEYVETPFRAAPPPSPSPPLHPTSRTQRPTRLVLPPPPPPQQAVTKQPGGGGGGATAAASFSKQPPPECATRPSIMCPECGRAARWGCLAALSCVLPCLWLYWPLRGCKRAVEACYARHSRTGCRCRPPLPTPEKRLLDSSPDF
ncbi:hypothetical protein NQ315_004687 [Exocentrus adspersus]|uniref:Uncharacterized protein n=1 Tax=Exocentrus adspersus TaxID=1586481 RepID=A0AAV8V9Z0_9CUCU|nr:hypothetical protein NQ315_004687 [Exocentrus adspersus]